jgi:histidine triad (HIT) family protein
MESRKNDHMAHCTFCELIQGSAEVSICHEDADAIAFMDIQPVNTGHVLVVPREHHESLLDVPEELGLHLFKITMQLANAIRRVTGTNDLNIVVNSGAAAGQDEPHYHVHIIPRKEGDGFDIPLPFNGSQMPDRTLLDANAALIIAALRDPMRDPMLGAAMERDGESTSTTSAASRSPAAGKPAEWRSDHSVTLRVFRESAAAARQSGPQDLPDQTGAEQSRAEEGPHGELRYEPRVDGGDVA